MIFGLIFLLCLFFYVYFVIGRLVHKFLTKGLGSWARGDPSYVLTAIFWPMWAVCYLPIKFIISIPDIEKFVINGFKSFIERGKT